MSIIPETQSNTEFPVLNMPAKWVNLIDDGLDDNFEGFLCLIEQFTGRNMVPVPSHILQLIGLIVNSMAFLTPQTLPRHSDPIVQTGEKVAVRAYSFIDSLIKTSGPQTFLRPLPGHNWTRDIYGHSRALVDLNIVTKEALNYQDCHPFLKRVIDASHVWEILSSSESSPHQTISPGGWDLLDLLTTAWEIDLKNNGISHDPPQPDPSLNEKKPFFPHFLRQFTPSSAGGFRLDARFLDIIFEPFHPKSAASSYLWGCAINTRSRAQQLSMRIFHLLEQLDNDQLFESGRLREDVVNRMRALETPDLNVFVNTLPPDHASRLPLLTRFLESITRSPSSSSSTALTPSHVPSGSKTLSPAHTLSVTSNKSNGLKRTHSRSSLKLDDRPTDLSVSPNSKVKLLSLSSLITRLLPRPLLEIPASSTSTVDSSLLLDAESRYLSVLNVVLSSLLMMYKSTRTKRKSGLNLVREGSLRAAVNGIFDQVTHVCGSKLDTFEDKKLHRLLFHRKLIRSIKAFESLASQLEQKKK